MCDTPRNLCVRNALDGGGSRDGALAPPDSARDGGVSELDARDHVDGRPNDGRASDDAPAIDAAAPEDAPGLDAVGPDRAPLDAVASEDTFVLDATADDDNAPARDAAVPADRHDAAAARDAGPVDAGTSVDGGGVPTDAGPGCVRPTAATTGVPPGTTLTEVPGNVTVTTPGAVLEAGDYLGSILIRANDVVVRRSRVRGAISVGTLAAPVTGVLIEDVEIGPDTGPGSLTVPPVGPRGYTLRRANIHNWAKGPEATTDVVIERSYLHHPWGGGSGGVQSFVPVGPGPIVLRCNHIDVSVLADGSTLGPAGYAYQGSDQRGPSGTFGVLVLDENYLSGGGYTINVRHTWASVTITSNTWTRAHAFGPYAYVATEGDGTTSVVPTWSSNRYDDGQVIPPP